MRHGFDGGGGQGAGLIGREVEDEGGVATDGFEVHLEQAFGRRGGFAAVPEPTFVGGFGVALAGVPIPAVDVAACAVAHAPVGFTGPALFVADPAGFAADAPHHTVGEDLVDGVAEVGHVVVDIGVAHVDGLVLTAVVTVATVGAVKPHFELVVAVLGGFETLAKEDLFYIAIGAVEGGVAIPRRDVEAIFHVELARSFGEVSGDIGLLGVGVGGGGGVVRGGGGGPEAEAVVVLDDGDAAAHAGVFGGLEPLFGVGHTGGRETVFVFVAVTPFQTGVGIHAIVEEGVEFRFLPFELAGRGNGMHGGRFVVRVGEGLLLQVELALGVGRKRETEAAEQSELRKELHGMALFCLFVCANIVQIPRTTK